MTTLRMYFTNTASAQTVTQRGAWTRSFPSVCVMQATKADSGTTVSDSASSPPNPHSVHNHTMVSPAFVSGGTFAGTVAGVIRLGSSSGNLAAMYPRLHIYVMAGSTNVVRGTLLSSWVRGSSFTAESSSSTLRLGREIPSTTLSSVDVLAGDRLIVEFGSQITSASGLTSSGTVGGTAADVTVGGSTTNAPPWLDFSDLAELYTAAAAPDPGLFFLAGA